MIIEIILVILGDPCKGGIGKELVQLLSHVQLFATHGLQHARLLCPSVSPKGCSNSCLLSW